MGKILDRQEDLQLKEFATLPALKGRQFGRNIYSSMIKFKDLQKFLQAFPQVQRDIIPRRVASIRRYILTGLEKYGNPDRLRFFSSMTVTYRGTAFYDEETNKIAINTMDSRLSINDGQHRNEAIITAIDQLERDFASSKDKDKTARLKHMIDELKEMTISVVIFEKLSEREEKQLFHDLNNLSQRPSRNANIRLNQTDLVAQMSLELSTENRYLMDYGVELDKVSLHKNNPNTVLLSTVYVAIKEILGHRFKFNKHFLNRENYEDTKQFVNDTFDQLFYALPADIKTKGKYLTDKSYTIKTISKFICNARTHLDMQISDLEIFSIIESVDWSYNMDMWERFGGQSNSDSNIVFGAGTSGGVKAVYSALMELATNEEFLAEVKERGMLKKDAVLKS